MIIVVRLSDVGKKTLHGRGFRRQKILDSPRGVERFHKNTVLIAYADVKIALRL